MWRWAEHNTRLHHNVASNYYYVNDSTGIQLLVTAYNAGPTSPAAWQGGAGRANVPNNVPVT